MKFDTPAGTNPIDRGTVVGRAHLRVEGTLKTTGSAPYAYERHDVVANQAYGVVLGSAIATGRIRSIDTSLAKAAPGVLAVVTGTDVGPLGVGDFNSAKVLAGPDVQHYHQAVAVVVAETFEQATAGAALIHVDYEREKGAFDLAAVRDTGVEPKGDLDSVVGDFGSAYLKAPVKLDETYTTPDQSHTMMEPFATIAAWDGDVLKLWTSIQVVSWGTRDMAKTLGIAPEKVHISSPYVGGGFGAKGSILSDAVMAALGAKAAGAPGQDSASAALDGQ